MDPDWEMKKSGCHWVYGTREKNKNKKTALLYLAHHFSVFSAFFKNFLETANFSLFPFCFLAITEFPLRLPTFVYGLAQYFCVCFFNRLGKYHSTQITLAVFQFLHTSKHFSYSYRNVIIFETVS